jgi:hypothetical protein
MIIWLMQRRRSTVNTVKRNQSKQKLKLKAAMAELMLLAVSVPAAMAEVAMAVTVAHPLAELAEHLVLL